MTTGLTHVIACPHCGGVALRRTVDDDVESPATIWTDGKRECPAALPGSPDFARCVHCQGFFWPIEAPIMCECDALWPEPLSAPPREQRETEMVVDFKERGVVRRTTLGDLGSVLPPDWFMARYVQLPSAKDYRDALVSETGGSIYAEVYLRTQLWWSINDMLRGRRRQIPAEYAHEHARNLRILAQLIIEDSGEEQVTKAELHRELGELDHALRLLKNVPAPVAEAAGRIKRLALEGSSRVEILFGPNRAIKP